MTTLSRNFIYLEEFGFIFAYVPKVACTNWKSLLRYMIGKEDWLDNRIAHDRQNSGLRYLDLSDPDDLLLLKTPTISKYSMVRNPYTRALSGYLNKITHYLPLDALGEKEAHFKTVTRHIEQFRQETLDTSVHPEISFEVFSLWLRDSGSWFTADEHWAPQVRLLNQPDVKFDYIGRFENLQNDAKYMLAEMGCQQEFPTQKQVNFAPTNATSKIDEYLSPECKALIEEIYCEDFSHFNYSITP